MSTIHNIRAHEQELFKINWTKIEGSCQSGRKVVTYDSKSDLPLEAMRKKPCEMDQNATFMNNSAPLCSE